MKFSLILIVALLSCAALGRTLDKECPSYDTAVDVCHNRTNAFPYANKAGLCAFWQCVSSLCYKPHVHATTARVCGMTVEQLTTVVKPTPLPAGVIPRAPTRHTVGTPNAASPCGGGSGPMDKEKIRHWLLDTSMNVYYDRANEHYTEGNQRWSGISGHVCPPHAPPYSDCSSTVTWIYWTLFGNGPDFLNNEHWQAGYTGSMDGRGSPVDADTAHLKVGDLCFYYNPVGHVAIYVGGGNVVSHGADPVGYFNFRDMPLNFCRRYIE